jgi:hypothetical protein
MNLANRDEMPTSLGFIDQLRFCELYDLYEEEENRGRSMKFDYLIIRTEGEETKTTPTQKALQAGRSQAAHK